MSKRKSDAENGAAAAAGSTAASAGPSPGQGEVRFDTSDLKSSYCNVANASSTREEVVLNFGLNDSWDRSRGAIDVRLLHRVVMSPPAASRLHALLGRLIEEHTGKYGPMDPGRRGRGDADESGSV